MATNDLCRSLFFPSISTTFHSLDPSKLAIGRNIRSFECRADDHWWTSAAHFLDLIKRPWVMERLVISCRVHQSLSVWSWWWEIFSPLRSLMTLKSTIYRPGVWLHWRRLIKFPPNGSWFIHFCTRLVAGDLCIKWQLSTFKVTEINQPLTSSQCTRYWAVNHRPQS